MFIINGLALFTLGIVLHTFIAGIFRKEYLLTKGRAILGVLCLFYLSAYAVLLHTQIAFFSYSAKEGFQDFMQFICEVGM